MEASVGGRGATTMNATFPMGLLSLGSWHWHARLGYSCFPSPQPAASIFHSADFCSCNGQWSKHRTRQDRDGQGREIGELGIGGRILRFPAWRRKPRAGSLELCGAPPVSPMPWRGSRGPIACGDGEGTAGCCRPSWGLFFGIGASCQFLERPS